MNDSAVIIFLNAAHQCALAMMENAIYIQKELPHVSIDDSRRKTAEELCGRLLGTKHDIIHELGNVREKLDGEPTAEQIFPAIDRIVTWIWEDVQELHRFVKSLHAAVQEEHRQGLAFMLFAESATNILVAFAAAKDAADAVKTADFPGCN